MVSSFCRADQGSADPLRIDDGVDMKRAISLALGCALMAGACASTGGTPHPFPQPRARSRPVAPSPPPVESHRSEVSEYDLVGTALELRGVPYKNGGTDRTGFDCSGFTQYVFAQYGVPLPREVRDQFKTGKAV